MKAPIVRVFIQKNKRDLSDRIESFRYEDCLNEDDIVELNIKTGYVLDTADDDDIVAGTIIQYQFGYAGLVLSETHRARITDIEVTYAERIKMKIRATDMGSVMKKSSSLKIWKNVTSTQIATEIAERYDLVAKVDETTKVWTSLPQGNKSDFKFLSELAAKETAGDYIFYIRSGELHFEKRGLDKTAMQSYAYGQEGVISFAPKYRESTAGNATNSAKTVAVDGETKKTITSSSDDDKDKDTTLGQKIIYVDVNNNPIK